MNYKTGYNNGYSAGKSASSLTSIKLGTLNSSNYNSVKTFSVANLGANVYSKLTRNNFCFIPTEISMYNNSGNPSQDLTSGFTFSYNPSNATLSICMGYSNGYNVSFFLVGDVYCTYPS